MPHEFDFVDNKSSLSVPENLSHNSAYLTRYDKDNQNKMDRVHLRERSGSQEIPTDLVVRAYKLTKFGKEHFDESYDSEYKKKIGPLKIVRLPSDRSIP